MTQISSDMYVGIKLLNDGEVIAIPTETVYGLAANALNTEAVKKIFTIKNRPLNNPLIVHTHSIEEIEKYVEVIPDLIRKLIKKFSPGPITYLLPKKNDIPGITTSNSNLVAIRIPKHKVLLKLLKQLKYPLAAPSANRFGYISPTRAKDVVLALDNRVKFVLDGGECKIGLESTIVECIKNKIIIHRLGSIGIEDISQYLNCKVIVKKSKNNNNTQTTAGQNKSHYSPNTPTFSGNIEKLVILNSKKKIGIISFKRNYKNDFKNKNIDITEIILSKRGETKEAAKRFYKSLISLDKKRLDVILIEKFDDSGLGAVLNDRIKKAIFKFNVGKK